MSPQNFRPNLSANRAIKFSGERGINVLPTGEGVMVPKAPKIPQPPKFKPPAAPKVMAPKVKRSGRRYYGEIA